MCLWMIVIFDGSEYYEDSDHGDRACYSPAANYQEPSRQELKSIIPVSTCIYSFWLRATAVWNAITLPPQSSHRVNSLPSRRLWLNLHIEHICSTGLRALNKVGILFAGHSIEAALQLYTAKVRPHLECTYRLWCASRSSNKTKVVRVHRLALLRVSGANPSTPTDSLDVLFNTSPIQLRLDEVLLHEYTRIMRGPPGEHLCTLVTDLMDDFLFSDHRIMTPLRHNKMAVWDLTVNIDFNMITTRTHQTLSRLITYPPEVSLIPERMGSAGTRTAEQKTIARAHADNLFLYWLA